MKGGRISRHIQPARAIHIISIDPGSYHELMYENFWLHTLPDATSYELAVDNLKRWGAWDEVPASVREFLSKADPSYDSIKADEFERMRFRIFGAMPGPRQTAKLPAAMKKAEELGYKARLLADDVGAIEANQAGLYLSEISKTIERSGQPFEPPCALFTSGEVVVAVGKADGVGGRNQEFALSAATRIAGSRGIVIASVDTDGTDGPGTQFVEGADRIPCLAGGIVDGMTLQEAERAGIDVAGALKSHDTTSALWGLNSGILAEPNISLNDLTVSLIMQRC